MKHKVHEREIDGIICPIGYKVVTTDLKSTGLRKTPVVQFYVDVWNINEVFGVWAARVPSFATYVRSWIKQRYGIDTRTFIVELKRVRDVRKHGVHANGIRFLEELTDLKMYDVSKAMGIM